MKDNVLRFSQAIEAKKLVLNVSYPNGALFAYVDVEALQKILSNLLDNAIKYGSGNLKLQLSADDDSKYFTILISNDGNIIPYAMKDKIFETFFRLKGAEKEAGTGIGLPLARYLTELHKGNLILRQNNENLNTFALTIPIHQDIEFNI